MESVFSWGSPPDHWNPVIINALKLYVGFWGIPKGQLRMALLSSVTVPLFLPHVFPLGLYLGLGMGVGKRQFDIPGSHSDSGGHLGKRVRLTKKTRPGVFSHYNPDPGHPTPRRWKRLRPPFLRRRGE